MYDMSVALSVLYPAFRRADESFRGDMIMLLRACTSNGAAIELAKPSNSLGCMTNL